MGEKQKNALLTPDELKNLKNYSDLVEKNTRPLNIMFNPQTGYTGLSEIALKSILGGGTTGGIIGGIPGAILGAITPGVAAKIPVKVLTNPSAREWLIERMIKAREKETRPQRNIAPLIEALMQTASTQT